MCIRDRAEAPAEEEASGDADCAAEDVLCIGLVTDVGRVDDKSFNQSAWEGAQQAAEALGAADVNYVETTNATDYAANIDLFAGQGYDIIVTVGFAMGEATAAAAATYPDIDFIDCCRDDGRAYHIDFMAVSREIPSGVRSPVSYTHLDVYKRQGFIKVRYFT